MNIFEFENKYKSILENIEEWAYIRIKFGYKMKDQNLLEKQVNIKINQIKNFIHYIKSIFYGFTNWFNKYDYLCFSDSSQRKIINGQYYDKLFDSLINKLSNKTLIIELPNKKHYRINQVKSKYIVSEIPIKILSYITKIFVKVHTINELDKLFLKENIKCNYLKYLHRFNSEYLVYKFILKLYKPKSIFISCFYCRPWLVKAANDLNIKVVELQHGVINKEHFAYVSSLKLDKKYFPTYLLSFGLNEKNLKGLLISNVYPIGSFYLEHIKLNFYNNKELNNLIKPYKVIVGVTMQKESWEIKELIAFIKKAALENDQILYIMIPRFIDNIDYNLPSNVVMYNKIDCYNIIMHCDIHVTLYSSCALEAPSLGIPNILININNFAYRYYKDSLSSYHTLTVSNIQDFFKSVDKLTLLDKQKIQIKNQDIFIDKYDEKISYFLKCLLCI